MVPRLLNRFYENIHAGVREQSFLKRFLFQTAVKVPKNEQLFTTKKKKLNK